MGYFFQLKFRLESVKSGVGNQGVGGIGWKLSHSNCSLGLWILLILFCFLNILKSHFNSSFLPFSLDSCRPKLIIS
jgi:hypothetical protein